MKDNSTCLTSLQKICVVQHSFEHPMDLGPGLETSGIDV